MKNKFKFIVAVCAITIATFGSFTKSMALKDIGGRDCIGSAGICKVNTMTGAETPGYPRPQ